ncbi:hypothetical protein M422DRAFT_24792 [Sphaerobolus stellatus SS14]|nr:hypothetical protein M422DRAFT_24792 [Sphaerobolus stellatus SS14]
MSATPTESPHNSQLLFVGQQCHKEQCYMVDFLPFKCDHCEHKYCSDHFKPGDHACEKYDPSKHDRIAPNCPLCDTPVAIPQGQDPNLRMEHHIDHECKVTTGRKKTGTMPVCARGKCGKKLIAPIKCNGCNKQFCAAHRYQSTHACSSISGSSNSNSLGKGASPSAGQKVANQTAAVGVAAMAAIKRGLANPATTSSSPSTSKPAPSRQPVSVRAVQAEASTSSSAKHNPFSKTDRCDLSLSFIRETRTPTSSPYSIFNP